MKVFIQSPCFSGNVDGPVDSMLRQIPGECKASHLEAADAIIVPITHFHWFKFNPEAMDKVRGRRWVLMDYSEFGWDWDQGTSYNWGSTMLNLPKFGENEEYRKFDQFVRDNPPILTFQRELLQKDRTDKRIPIEYTAWLPEHGNDPKEDFFKRPLEVSYYWGRSHEDRPRVHGEIFLEASNKGFDVLTQFDQIENAIKDNANSKKWLAVFTPHYARIRVEDIQGIIRRSKATIVMPGCGVKTFRHGEHCGDAIMAAVPDNLAWSYPWVIGENCLNATPSGLTEQLQDKDRLYQIYVNAMENARNYRYQEYLRRWVIGNIERVL